MERLQVFSTTPKKKATFVLVHGAWHGGWGWKKVSALLEVHIQDIVSMLEFEDLQDVTLVGHIAMQEWLLLA